METTFVRAFKDNYIWVLRHAGNAAVVDPGDAAPVLDYLAQSGDRLCAIIVTHHHPDHIGGVAALTAQFPVPVFGPAAEEIGEVTKAVKPGDHIRIDDLDAEFDVIDVSGHTRGHVAYYRPNSLFCGDALFTFGCGRLFEGTPEQAWHSLSRLAALPSATRVYCAHEYTSNNLPFALLVDPDNPALHARAARLKPLLAAGLPTVPSTMGEELETNPFLRWHDPALIASAARHRGSPATSPVEVFAALREWRNKF
jgi:hydroxyacylglutathione hydrolase